MIGRNDPCLCGSGKKYKKCCEKDAQITTTSLFHEEIENMLQTFYETYPQQKDIQQYIQLLEAWRPKLKDALQKELIEAVVLDEFFFHKEPTIWLDYLKKTRKKTVRPQMLQLLETWAAPFMFIGQVMTVDDAYINVQHAITGETYYIRREHQKSIPEGMHIFTFLLPDGSFEAQHYLAVSTLLFFSPEYSGVFEAFAKKCANKGQANSYLQENNFTLWQQLVEGGYVGEEFTTFEADVLAQVKEFLQQHALNGEQLIPIVEDYLVEQQPSARKAAAIAAGAIRFGQERELFERKFTVKEIAEQFAISPASLNKYYQSMNEYNSVVA